MNLSLSAEQLLLKESVAKFVREHSSVERRRALRDQGKGFDADNWRRFAELGWLALPFAEHDGGFGGGAQELAVLMEEFGRGLVLEPYLINVVVCGGLLAAASEAQRAAHLPALMAGRSQWAFAFAEAHSRYRLEDVTLQAAARGDDQNGRAGRDDRGGRADRADRGGWVLNGTKISVPNGDCAAHLLVSARTAGGRRDRDGISLFIVNASSPGVKVTGYPLVDGTRGADIQFTDVVVGAGTETGAEAGAGAETGAGAEAGAGAMVGTPGRALELIEDVVARALVAMGAEALGAMDALLEQTVEYTKTRQQFGQPIGKFQALQHRMADMYLHCQAMRSLLYYAAIARDEGRPDMLRAAAGLKVKLGEAGRFVSQQAVQLHGGIGMTDELAIGHYFKRLLLLNSLFGDSQHHLDRYLAL